MRMQKCPESALALAAREMPVGLNISKSVGPIYASAKAL